ncbi:hypothetical protein D9758_018008 [Tetrapyrgos nigripes]|uniref:Uncharacterized protein n=1 Tax=Tetrapyrgos nigripes TaxID=182062 RepID=A0A8H5CBF1_9AGAR|nr:hypothetical protein D9758_018008 [Tetrapyrgos nigripes]
MATSAGTRTFLALASAVVILLLGVTAPVVYDALTNPTTQVKHSLSFHPKFPFPIAMHYEATTVHYTMQGAEADEEFAKLLPPHGHTVHLISESGAIETFTVTLFHQLKCLDIIRREYNELYPSNPDLTQHCLTYLQQTILCRPYLGLEVTKNRFATGRKSREIVCRDWEVVYAEATRNWGVYSAIVNGTGHA